MPDLSLTLTHSVLALILLTLYGFSSSSAFRSAEICGHPKWLSVAQQITEDKVNWAMVLGVCVWVIEYISVINFGLHLACVNFVIYLGAGAIEKD